MATIFLVPDQFNGLSLSEIQNKTNASFRPDVLAGFLGINPNEPLQAGQVLTTSAFPQSYVGTSGEWQAVSNLFNKSTTEDYAAQQADQQAQSIIDAQQKQIDAEKKAAQDLFGPDNPFTFDEYLAKQSAQQEYLPYYSELLQDYLDKVGVSKDSVQSEGRLLKELNTTSQGTAGVENRAYDRAVAEAERGFAGQGMFFSGIKSRTLGASEAEKQYSVAGTAQDITRQNRDIFGTGRQYETAVAGGVEQRRGEQLKQYYAPRVQDYLRQFPTGNDVLAGYVPPDYLRY